MDITIQKLSVTFPMRNKYLYVLRDIDLRFPQGKITAIVGESGSGKSVLGAAVMRLLDKSAHVSGKIFLGDTELLRLPEKDMEHIREKEIGWIAQNPIAALDPMRKIGPLVSEIICLRQNRSPASEKTRTMAQLKKFGLQKAEAVYENYPGELSGGMAQRVLTAMMTIEEPPWLIADESTKGLDAFVRRQVGEMFRYLCDERGASLMLITHDLPLAKKISDYTVVLYAGEVIETGETEKLFLHPLHPYTVRLLEAQPEWGMKPVKGIAPDMSCCREGCVFAPRCDFYDASRCEKPQYLEGTVRHSVKCWKGVYLERDI